MSYVVCIGLVSAGEDDEEVEEEADVMQDRHDSPTKSTGGGVDGPNNKFGEPELCGKT